MNPFFILFSLITVISVVISGALLLSRRKGNGRWRSQEHIQSPVFNFFTTLYAFFIGFAIVTLWSAFLAAKTNVTREADSMMIVYRTAKHLPGSGAFRQAVASYVKTVIDVEWGEMEKGAMSPEAGQRFDDIWSRFYELGARPEQVRRTLHQSHRSQPAALIQEHHAARQSLPAGLGDSHIWFYISGLRSIFYQSRAYRGVSHL